MRKQQKVGLSQQTSPGAELWSSAEQLFWDHMREVENKWNTLKLNDDIWAKLIYFEQNRRLAKAYVSAPVLTVDGSTHGLDGFRIGLSGIDNTYRSLDSMASLRSIGLGVKLRIDSQGNILIRRVGKQHNGQSSQVQQQQHCSIWFRQWPKGPKKGEQQVSFLHRQLSDDDNDEDDDGDGDGHHDGQQESTTMLDNGEQSYKLFDMRKFRLQLERRRLVGGAGSRRWQAQDWRHCVSIISFMRSTPSVSSLIQTKLEQPNTLIGRKSPLEEPCWLMLINIIAIDMIKSAFQKEPLTTLHLSNSNLELRHQQQQQHQKQRRNFTSASSKLASSSSALFPAVSLAPASGEERAKRLRRAQSKFRLSPMGPLIHQNSLHNHLNQSAQHLSRAATGASNSSSSAYSASAASIYTTFTAGPNSTRRHQHDYNSRSSHLGSSLVMPQYQRSGRHKFHHHQHHLSNYRYQDDGRILVPATTPQSLSLSAFDLHLDNNTSQQLRLPISRMQSAIKMNYNEEEEEEGEHKEEIAPVSMVNKGNRKSALNDTNEKVKGMTETSQATAPAKKQNSSSSSSETSSSGCADNDYFLSNSSSSVASSGGGGGTGSSNSGSSSSSRGGGETVNNFSSSGSQPASSSGIASSTTGSTSDEQGGEGQPNLLPSGRKKVGASEGSVAGSSGASSEMAPSPEPATTATNKLSSKPTTKQKLESCAKTGTRAPQIKRSSNKYTTTGMANGCCGCCCKMAIVGHQRLPGNPHEDLVGHHLLSTSSSLSLALEQEQLGAQCNCCACDCACYSPSLAPTTEQHLSCGCPQVEADNYESCFVAKSAKKCEMDNEQVERISHDPACTITSAVTSGANEDEITCPADGKLVNGKALAKRGGWQRRYSRILPKFIFSSTNNNNNNNNNNRHASQQTKITQRQGLLEQENNNKSKL